MSDMSTEQLHGELRNKVSDPDRPITSHEAAARILAALVACCEGIHSRSGPEGVAALAGALAVVQSAPSPPVGIASGASIRALREISRENDARRELPVGPFGPVGTAAGRSTAGDIVDLIIGLREFTADLRARAARFRGDGSALAADALDAVVSDLSALTERWR